MTRPDIGRLAPKAIEVDRVLQGAAADAAPQGRFISGCFGSDSEHLRAFHE